LWQRAHPLGDDQLRRVGHDVGLLRQIEHSHQRRRRVVRVQRREHEVAGQGEHVHQSHDLCVADFADHDDVRRATGDRPDRRRERHPRRRLDRNLHDAGEVHLDRVFDGHELVGRVGVLREQSVEGGRLAGPARSGDDDEPPRAAVGGAHPVGRAGRKAERVDRERRRPAAQQPQRRDLALVGRDEARANVAFGAVVGSPPPDSPVLRPGALVDVARGHPLQLGHEQGQEAGVEAEDRVEQPVDPDPCPRAVGFVAVGVEVHIAGAAGDGQPQEPLDDGHDLLARSDGARVVGRHTGIAESIVQFVQERRHGCGRVDARAGPLEEPLEVRPVEPPLAADLHPLDLPRPQPAVKRGTGCL
jgi:hypothetical protein